YALLSIVNEEPTMLIMERLGERARRAIRVGSPCEKGLFGHISRSNTTTSGHEKGASCGPGPLSPSRRSRHRRMIHPMRVREGCPPLFHRSGAPTIRDRTYSIADHKREVPPLTCHATPGRDVTPPIVSGRCLVLRRLRRLLEHRLA